ncbi:MAG: hypothetical protein CFE37_03345 [Alphaproteobacteria bacterium PA4]|nr:MAG: hypothetical protein CFE37_03345 [Alphaproteobacteria bacterium PA4]
MAPSPHTHSPSPLEGEGDSTPLRRAGRGGSYPPVTLDRAKSMRSAMTEAETRLWHLLRAKRLERFKFRRQQPIGPFIADFVCQAQRLIVEADGSQHAESTADADRTAWLTGRGYRVLRFWNADILDRPDDVMATIYAARVEPLSPLAFGESPSPSRGEGKVVS